MVATPYFDQVSRPIQSLFLIFVLWKALLLLVAVAAPTPAYDTATALLFRLNGAASDTALWARLVQKLCIKLTRWDAIYFVSVARRGYLWEQEWAFGCGWTYLVAVPASVLRQVFSSLTAEAVGGICIAHLSHWGSVLVLHRLAKQLRASAEASFVAAALHIFAPAGMFLSAPYGESTFALLNYSGMLLYTMSGAGADASQSHTHKARPFLTIAAGVCFGLATSVRSNGVLSGLIFACHILRHLPYLAFPSTRLSSFQQCVAATLGGIANAMGYVIPQAIAYAQFCHADDDSPAWCNYLVPSIWSYVQRKYWNVGFLRYWDVQNIPLFIMAGPGILLLLRSGVACLVTATTEADSSRKEPNSPIGSQLGHEQIVYRQTLALPQLVLGVLAPLSYHVQIINRIASGYALPYIWLAEGMQQQPGTRLDTSWWFVRWMIIWAIVQGGLFASYLPPA